MRPSILANAIASHHNHRRAMLIEGEPGLGKSSIPKQVAAQLGIGCTVFNVPTRPAEDYGVPWPDVANNDLKFFVAKGLWPFEGSDCPDEGILVLDELSGGDTAMQKNCMCLIQDRHIHGHPLKPGWSIVATGNRQADRAGANRLLTPLANRLTRYTLEASLDDWCSWAIDNGVALEVVSFVRFRPAMLAAFDPHADSFPTPRAWAEGVSPFVGEAQPWEFEAYKGAVGEVAAAEFTGYLKMYRKLPNPDMILLDPENAEVPTEPGVLYAVATAVAARASVENMDRIYAYVRRLPHEFGVLAMVDARRRDPKTVSTRAFIEWASKEGREVLMGRR